MNLRYRVIEIIQIDIKSLLNIIFKNKAISCDLIPGNAIKEWINLIETINIIIYIKI